MRIFITLTLILLASPANAFICGDFKSGVATLLDKYGETLAAEFTTQDNAVILIFGNSKTQTWTIIERRNKDTGCVIKLGNGFVGIEPPEKGSEL